jgi:Co/Zn/Cd efflux system component
MRYFDPLLVFASLMVLVGVAGLVITVVRLIR